LLQHGITAPIRFDDIVQVKNQKLLWKLFSCFVLMLLKSCWLLCCFVFMFMLAFVLFRFNVFVGVHFSIHSTLQAAGEPRPSGPHSSGTSSSVVWSSTLYKLTSEWVIWSEFRSKNLEWIFLYFNFLLFLLRIKLFCPVKKIFSMNKKNRYILLKVRS
jgi:hypothetical protein